jgi:hypothetical protein
MDNKTIILIIALILLSFGVIPAIAADTELIAGMPKNASSAEVIVYIFNLAVAIGAFLAVVIIVMAGIEWMTSEGNPSKVEGAKDKIKNTLLGVAILIGCYLILGVINPSLTTIKINNLSCSNGIVVTTVATADAKSKQVCISENISSISYSIASTVEWNFPADTLLAVYTFSGENYTGTKTEYSCENGGCSGSFGDISGVKSIYFLKKEAGFYLYDQVNYKTSAKPYPYHLSTSIPDLGEFSNFTGSIKKIDPNPAVDNSAYLGIGFTDPNYTGACTFIGENVSNMNGPATEKYTSPIQTNSMSSMIVNKGYIGTNSFSPDKGTIILYSAADCGESTSTSIEIKMCPINIFGVQKNIIGIGGQCPTWNDGDEVMSLWISGPIGIALSTAPTGLGTYGKCRILICLKLTVPAKTLGNTRTFSILQAG